MLWPTSTGCSITAIALILPLTLCTDICNGLEAVVHADMKTDFNFKAEVRPAGNITTRKVKDTSTSWMTTLMLMLLTEYGESVLIRSHAFAVSCGYEETADVMASWTIECGVRCTLIFRDFYIFIRVISTCTN